jgi:type VI secretion system protein ImpM
MSRPVDVQLVYFGKLPARGDFVRNGDALGLTDRLDQWLTHGLERMARDPRWKEHYDQAGVAHFAFLGVRSRAIVVGHLLASRDASGRRFPFVTAGRADVDQPLAFMRLAPLALQPVWDHLAQACAQAHAAADVVPGLNALCQAPARLESDPRRFLAQYHEFLEVHTLGQLQQSLHAEGRPCDLRARAAGAWPAARTGARQRRPPARQGRAIAAARRSGASAAGGELVDRHGVALSRAR